MPKWGGNTEAGDLFFRLLYVSVHNYNRRQDVFTQIL